MPSAMQAEPVGAAVSLSNFTLSLPSPYQLPEIFCDPG